MSYHFEATDDFFVKIAEVDRLVELASFKEEDRILFLKLASVSLITKFQVYVETCLDEFKYKIIGKKSGELSSYIKFNSLYLELHKEVNPLQKFAKYHNKSTGEYSQIVDFLKSFEYLYDEDTIITPEFNFDTKYPLGKTGTKELIHLFQQIDGCDEPFGDFEKFNEINSALFIRHAIIHEDRFSGTELTVKNNIINIKNLVEYIDEYLARKIGLVE